MPTPIRTAGLIVAFVLVGFYWLIFCSQPLVEGNADISRGFFMLSAIVYPEGYLLDSWTDDGRLPLSILDRVPIVAATMGWLALAITIGWPWCQSMVITGASTSRLASRLVQLSLAGLVGLALLSTVTLMVGLAGGLGSRLPLIVVVAILVVASYQWAVVSGQLPGFRFPLSGVRSEHAGAPRATSPATNKNVQQAESVIPPANILQRVINNAMIVATLWLGAAVMLGAWVPPREFDVVEYHLQAPKEFYQAAQIRFVPHNVYANMPLGAEMHSLAAMTLLRSDDTWLGGLIGKSITASITILGAVLLGAWLSLRCDNLCGWTGAGIWLGSPGIAHVATLGLIDGVLSTYVLATALTTWQAFRSSKEAEQHSSSKLLTGLMQSPWSLAFVLAGATAALKYPGLIYATMPCVVVAGIALVRSTNRRSELKIMALAAVLGMSLTCLPWYVKNWWLSGNPVYPLAANLFGGQTLTPEKISQWQAAHRVPPFAPANAGASEQLLGLIKQLGKDFTRVTLQSSFVQPAMIGGLVCALAWLLKRSKQASSTSRSTALAQIDRAGWFLLGWSIWILIVWWLATHRIDRFWLPITGLWSALAAWALWQLRNQSWALAQAILGFGLLYGVLINSSPVVTDNRYFVSLAALRDDVGDAEHPPRVPPIQTWINQNLATDGTRVLMIGEARVFEYRVDVLYSTCFDTNPGEPLLASKDANQQREALKSAGVSHVLINWVEIERYRSPGNYGFSAWPQSSDVEQMVRDGVLRPIDWGEGSDRVQLFVVN